jgi:hypothetical protein
MYVVWRRSTRFRSNITLLIFVTNVHIVPTYLECYLPCSRFISFWSQLYVRLQECRVLLSDVGLLADSRDVHSIFTTSRTLNLHCVSRFPVFRTLLRCFKRCYVFRVVIAWYFVTLLCTLLYSVGFYGDWWMMHLQRFGRKRPWPTQVLSRNLPAGTEKMPLIKSG